MGALPPVFIEFLGKSTGLTATATAVKAELAEVKAEGGGNLAGLGAVGTAALAGIGAAAAEAAVHTVHMAADFDSAMTRVRTGAGESAANMQMVGSGVLQMAGQVGQTTEQLTSGLYTVESASFHGADALTVLKDSAMGAKVGAADLSTMTDAVTTALNAYKLGAGDAASVTNSLIATESEGKTNLEALAGSMATVLPAASAAHVGLQEVLGAMATMTAQGTPAADAATYLRQTIGQLSNPSGKAAQEMQSLGLKAIDVSQNLGKNGLASTLEMLTDAIQSKMGPAGTVLIQHLQKAASNTSDYQKVLAGLPPAQQTYIGALATMVGGTKSMQAALELTGPHLADFKANTQGIADHVKAGGSSIEGWADVQKTLNQKLAEAKATAEALGIQIGQKLIPVISAVLAGVMATVQWFQKHHDAAIAVGGALAGVLAVGLYMAATAAWAFTAALLANPLTWIVIAVAAVGAAIALLATHWSTVWGKIKSVAQDVGGAVSGAWRFVSAETILLWRMIVALVVGAWRSVAAFFSSAYHSVADPVVNSWRMIERTTSEVFGAVASFFRKWWPLLLLIFLPPIGILLAIWNHCHTEILAVASAVWGAVSGFFVKTWQQICSVAEFAWRVFKQAVITPSVELWQWLSGLWSGAVDWLSAKWRLICLSAELIWAKIKSAIIDPVLKIYQDVTGFMDKTNAAIVNALLGAWHSVEHIGDEFLDIGTHIVDGIVHGVEGAGGKLLKSLKDLAGNALKSAKSFLGISSPSRVFSEQVGQWIPHGIAAGVAAHAHVAAGAVAQLSAGLAAQTITPQLSLAGPNSGSAKGSYGAGGGQVAVTTIVQLDGQELFRAVQPHALRNDRRNPSAGLVYVRAAH
ncbi:phage tail tape measure protein [Kitasatospora sp. GAS1066B]|uniref:phage tail tape measure protein n=1 Tax=Kitasatospora sp. GAS1066B TaxID=3156271 RepID=UPI00351875DC